MHTRAKTLDARLYLQASGCCTKNAKKISEKMSNIKSIFIKISYLATSSALSGFDLLLLMKTC